MWVDLIISLDIASQARFLPSTATLPSPTHPVVLWVGSSVISCPVKCQNELTHTPQCYGVETFDNKHA